MIKSIGTDSTGMRRYLFKPKDYVVITKYLLEYVESNLRSGRSCFKVTPNLGITYVNACVLNGVLRINEISINLELAKSVIRDDDSVYVIVNSELLPIKFYDSVKRKFYKLRSLGMDKPPTLEINGIHMHRIEGIDPLSDAYIKVKSIRPLVNGYVLDIGTGLGYTAITAMKLGARKVISVEVDENVLNIATFNPWSRELSNVDILLGNAIKIIKEFDDNTFTHLIHDPPRFELAGELYSYEFYREMYRVLKPGGKLFHYVGKPKQRRANIIKGVKERLRRAGFTRIIWIEDALGFKAIKYA